MNGKPGKRCRGRNLMPRDRQKEKSRGPCPRCGGEIFGPYRRCSRCRGVRL